MKSPSKNIGWRGYSAGEMGVNLQYGVDNPPPGGSLGQSYVTSMPTGRMSMLRRPLAEPPGTADGIPGKVVEAAAGNPDVYTIPTPGTIPERPYGHPRTLGVGQESSWRGGAYFANDKLITSDRHAFLTRGTELTGRDSGNTDPPKDGPARPSLRIVNRTINYQEGSDATANQDDLTRAYARNSSGQYMGTQGDPWTPVYGGTPGMYQPYGTYQGIGNVPIQGIQSSVAEGAPGDGPQSFQPGPPHGLHSPTMPDYTQTLGYYMAVPQMALPRIDRPSNSTIGGQSYSQTVIPQGQTGTAAQQATGPNNTGVGSGVSWQTGRTGGWRGRTSNGNS